MKRMLLVLMLVVFGVCARAAWAADAGEGERQRNATGDVIAAIKSTDSTAFRARGDGTAIYVADPYAPPWAQAVWLNAIDDTVSVPGWGLSGSNGTIGVSFTAESTFIMPFSAGGFRTCQIMLQAISDSANAYQDTTMIGYFALQVREHFTSNYDTLTTGVWRSWGGTTFASVDDSVASAWTRGGADVPWSGEHVFRIRISGRGYVNASSLPNGFFSGPYPIAIDLADPKSGRPVPPYISFRFRCLGVLTYGTGGQRKSSLPHLRLHAAFGM